MLFVLYCVDRPESLALRGSLRPEHLAYLRSLGSQVRLAGPLLSDDGSRSIGSLILLAAPDLRAAEAAQHADPYAKAGLFAEVRLTPFVGVLPDATQEPAFTK